MIIVIVLNKSTRGAKRRCTRQRLRKTKTPQPLTTVSPVIEETLIQRSQMLQAYQMSLMETCWKFAREDVHAASLAKIRLETHCRLFTWFLNTIYCAPTKCSTRWQTRLGTITPSISGDIRDFLSERKLSYRRVQ